MNSLLWQYKNVYVYICIGVYAYRCGIFRFIYMVSRNMCVYMCVYLCMFHGVIQYVCIDMCICVCVFVYVHCIYRCHAICVYWYVYLVLCMFHCVYMMACNMCVYICVYLCILINSHWTCVCIYGIVDENYNHLKLEVIRNTLNIINPETTREIISQNTMELKIISHDKMEWAQNIKSLEIISHGKMAWEILACFRLHSMSKTNSKIINDLSFQVFRK